MILLGSQAIPLLVCPHYSYMTWPGIESWPLRRDAGDW